MKRVAVVGAIVVLSGFPAAHAEAEISALEEAGIAKELAELNTILVEIKNLLAQQVETQSLDLLLKRTEFSSSRVIDIEKQLRSAEAKRRSTSDQKVRVEANLKSWVAELDAGTREATPEQEEVFLTRMDATIRQLDEKLAEFDREIEELRNRLAEEQRELRDWQDLLDKRLSGT